MNLNTDFSKSESTLRNKFKSPEWKARKKERTAANQAERARLNAEKAGRGMGDRVKAQVDIDNIGKRGAPQGKAARRGK